MWARRFICFPLARRLRRTRVVPSALGVGIGVVATFLAIGLLHELAAFASTGGLSLRWLSFFASQGAFLIGWVGARRMLANSCDRPRCVLVDLVRRCMGHTATVASVLLSIFVMLLPSRTGGTCKRRAERKGAMDMESRSWTIALAVLLSCACQDGLGQGSPEAAEGDPDSRSDGGGHGDPDSGTDGGHWAGADSGPGAASLQEEQEFWDHIAVCGEWVEQFATIDEMADAADAVVVGAVAGVATGNTVQGDAAEDFYVEVNLIVEVKEMLRGTIEDGFAVSFILPRVVTPNAVEPTIATMQQTRPRSPVLLLLRRRDDLGTDGLYRLVNDRGLWAETTRRAVDAPIVESGPLCTGHDDDLDAFAGGAGTMNELIDALRQ